MEFGGAFFLEYLYSVCIGAVNEIMRLMLLWISIDWRKWATLVTNISIRLASLLALAS